MPNGDDLIGAAEAAAILKIDRSTLSRRVKAGVIVPAKKLEGLRGPMLFTRSDVEALKPEEQAS